jgi:hypothetical protein
MITILTAIQFPDTHASLAKTIRGIALSKGFSEAEILDINADATTLARESNYLQQGSATRLRLLSTSCQDAVLEIINGLRDYSQTLEIMIIEEELPGFGGNDLAAIASRLGHGVLIPLIVSRERIEQVRAGEQPPSLRTDIVTALWRAQNGSDIELPAISA